MIRLGIVDFDSSHSIEFARRFNQVGVDRDQYVDGARVVLGWPGTSAMSPERIPLFTRQIEACGVGLVDSPEQMIGQIDAVLVLSLCGGAHLERARPFLEAGLPAYVDKPFACSWSDAVEMYRLADEHAACLLQGSALRFAAEVEQFHNRSGDYGALHGLLSYGPAKRAEGNPGLFHYGIHCVELLFELMGAGCREVTTIFTDETEVVTGRWQDGRIATLRGNRAGSTAYGFLAFCEQGVIHQPVSTRYAYRNLCRAIVRAIQGRQPPVTRENVLEVVRFVLASLESEQQGCKTIALDAIG
jgi:virulence factor